MRVSSVNEDGRKEKRQGGAVYLNKREAIRMRAKMWSKLEWCEATNSCLEGRTGECLREELAYIETGGNVECCWWMPL